MTHAYTEKKYSRNNVHNELTNDLKCKKCFSNITYFMIGSQFRCSYLPYTVFRKL